MDAYRLVQQLLRSGIIGQDSEESWPEKTKVMFSDRGASDDSLRQRGGNFWQALDPNYQHDEQGKATE